MEDDTDRPASNGWSKERLENGRWAPGNRSSPGNPNARKMFELRREILESASSSPEAVKAAFSRLFRRAVGKAEDKDGSSVDIEAMKLYLAYAVGRPTQAVEISGPDGEPLGSDLAALRAVILEVLAKFPEARVEVAAALMRLRSADDGPDPVAGD